MITEKNIKQLIKEAEFKLSLLEEIQALMKRKKSIQESLKGFGGQFEANKLHWEKEIKMIDQLINQLENEIN